MLNYKEKIPVISFFTGGGLLDMGFEKAGFKTVFANEYNVRIAQAFDFAFNHWVREEFSIESNLKANTKSIDELINEEIVESAFQKDTPKHFGIIGGPPCQDFSVSGVMKGLNGERGKYTLSFINKINTLLPSFFVMENVKGLMKFKSLKDDFVIINEGLTKNYYVTYKVHNALSFDVPQHRERMIAIGIRKDLLSKKIGDNLESYLNYSDYKNDFDIKSLKSQNTVKTALIQKHEIECVKNHIYPRLQPKTLTKVKNIKEGDTKRRSFRRVARDYFSPTLCFGHNEIFLHPTEHRRLSVRECLRLQGVDDTYFFDENSTSKTTMYRIISNGVPVPLAEGIGKTLLDFIVKFFTSST